MRLTTGVAATAITLLLAGPASTSSATPATSRPDLAAPGPGAAADEPAESRARDARWRFDARVLHEIDLHRHREPEGHAHDAPVDLPDGSLVLERGRFRPVPDVPGGLQTTHLRNNNRGQTVGVYAEIGPDGRPRVRGFLMRGRGVTRIDVPGAVVTQPLGVNDRGQVVGTWVGQDATVNPDTGETGPGHGFVWDKGHVRTFDVPGATTTAAYEINNRGQIVGNYTDAAGAQHGYVLRDGKVTTIDHPRASDTPNLTGTKVQGIDDRGRLVGAYGDNDGMIHAWVWQRGRFTDLEPPGAVQAAANQINDRGQIVGVYLDATPKLRSFLLERGRVTPIDAPGRCDTAAVGINDRGQIGIAATGTTDGSTCPAPGG
jgi:uncharacterized membrane protein